jgi:hypothetical protein
MSSLKLAWKSTPPEPPKTQLPNDMKERIIQLIIADRTRVITLAVSFALAITVNIATEVLGMHLSDDAHTQITLFFTLIFGWIIEAYASEANANGAKRVQQALHQVDDSIQVDRYIGPNTIAATESVVIKSATTAQPTAAQKKAPPKTQKKRQGKAP